MNSLARSFIVGTDHNEPFLYNSAVFLESLYLLTGLYRIYYKANGDTRSFKYAVSVGYTTRDTLVNIEFLTQDFNTIFLTKGESNKNITFNLCNKKYKDFNNPRLILSIANLPE